MVVELYKWMNNCKVKFEDLGYNENGKPILGLCKSLQPLKEDGSIDYTVYVSTELLTNRCYEVQDTVNIMMHEKLHLYCLDQFGIETEDIFIDYWLGKLMNLKSFYK